MAYINGKGVLFSPIVNTTEGGDCPAQKAPITITDKSNIARLGRSNTTIALPIIINATAEVE